MKMPAAAPLLTVQGLRVGFGGKQVVHGIDFAIAPGEIVTIGPDGVRRVILRRKIIRAVRTA